METLLHSLRFPARFSRVFLAPLTLALATGCAPGDDNGYSPEDAGNDAGPGSGPDATVSGGHDASSGADAGHPGGGDATTSEDSGGQTGSDASGGDDSSTSSPDSSTVTSDDAGLPTPIGAWTFDDQVSTANDAGSDAGPTDAGTEASTGDDGGGDASEDAGPADAGDDAGLDAGTAGDAGASADASTGGADASTGPLSSADVSGHGHPAVFQGTAKFGPGKSGGGLLLDGTTGCFADVGVPLLDTSKSFTVVTWTNLSTVIIGTWEVALSQDDVNGSVFGLKLRGDNNFYDFDVETTDQNSPGFVVAQSTTAGVANTWVHLAGVYDASAQGGKGTLTIYIDGSPQATPTVGQSMFAAGGHFVIGRGLYNDALGSWVSGTIDDVAVYDVALSAAQVAAIYSSQK